jgi:hypothetical protein
MNLNHIGDVSNARAGHIGGIDLDLLYPTPHSMSGMAFEAVLYARVPYSFG